MKKTFFSLLLLAATTCQAQFGRGADWHDSHMSDKAKLQYSRAWKIVGLTFVVSGIYLAKQKQNPQRIDVPFIIFGTIISIEGIRLKKSIKHIKY